MTPAQVQYIRDRLADWEAVPKACEPTVGLFGGDPQLPAIHVFDPSGRELWTSDDLVRTARHLRVLVDTCAAAYTREPGHPDWAWADAVLCSLALIWSDRPDYPKADARHDD